MVSSCGGSSVTSGTRGSLRWHKTFIDIEEDCGEEPVDPRIFKTDPGFRTNHGEEHMSTFGGEVAYVESLAEKLSSAWDSTDGVVHDGGSMGSADVVSADTADVRSLEIGHLALGSLMTDSSSAVPAVTSPKAAMPAPEQLPKGMSWKELRKHVHAKTQEISKRMRAQNDRAALTVVDELHELAGDAAELSTRPPFMQDQQAIRLDGARSPSGSVESYSAHPLQPLAQAGTGEQIQTAVANQVVAQVLLQAKAAEQGLASSAPVSEAEAAGETLASLAPWNPGSLGHPELCLRPCLYFAVGSCSNGDACQYCHLPHPKRPAHMDKRHREMLRDMSLNLNGELMLPLIRQKVQALTHSPEMLAIVDMIAEVCGLPVPEYAAAQGPGSGSGSIRRQHRTLLATLKAMSLRLLLATAGRFLSQHRPELEDVTADLFERLHKDAAAKGGRSASATAAAAAAAAARADV